MEKNMSMQKYSQEVLTNKVFEFVFGCAIGAAKSVYAGASKLLRIALEELG